MDCDAPDLTAFCPNCHHCCCRVPETKSLPPSPYHRPSSHRNVHLMPPPPLPTPPPPPPPTIFTSQFHLAHHQCWDIRKAGKIGVTLVANAIYYIGRRRVWVCRKMPGLPYKENGKGAWNVEQGTGIKRAGRETFNYRITKWILYWSMESPLEEFENIKGNEHVRQDHPLLSTHSSSTTQLQCTMVSVFLGYETCSCGIYQRALFLSYSGN